MTRTNIFVVAWDRPYIDKFADFSLPTLMSPGNIPAIARDRPLRFLFYTDRASLDYFQDRTRPLEQFGEISFQIFEETEVDGKLISEVSHKFSASSRKHEIDRLTQTHAIDRSLENGDREVLFFINQDLVLADGSISYAQRRLDEGKTAVAFPLLRLSLEGSNEVLSKIQSVAGDGISAREICDGMPENLHPVSKSSITNSQYFTTYPVSLLWPVKALGWVVRSFFPYSLALRCNPDCRRFDSTLDYDFLLNLAAVPEDIVIPQSSDDALGCKLTTESYLPSTAEPNTFNLNKMAHFVLAETNRAHRDLVNSPFRLMKSDAQHSNRTDWQSVIDLSADSLDKIYAFVDLLRDRLPKDSPEVKTVIGSHFGSLDRFLSPMRRSQKMETGG